MTRQGHYQKKAQLANGREPLECKAGHDEAKEESYFHRGGHPYFGTNEEESYFQLKLMKLMKLMKRATSNQRRRHATQVPREWCNDRGAWIVVGKNQFDKGT